MFKDIFQKKRKYATIPSDRAQRTDNPEGEERPRREIPEGLMNKCSKCGTIQYSKELEKNLKVCPSCGHHMRLNARERIEMTLDEGFIEYDADMVSVDPLDFPGYKSKLEQQTMKSGLKDAVVTGEGTIDGHPVVVAVMSFDFLQAAWARLSARKLRAP